VAPVPPTDPRAPSQSRSRSSYNTHPDLANVHGTVFGGHILSWIDEMGAMTAVRHCRRAVVTVLIDAVEFRAPIHIGDFALVEATITRAWTTSMEIRVTVDAESPLSGEQRRAAEAFVTFVAVDEQSRPQPVCPVAPQTPQERALYEGAEARRQARLVAREASPARDSGAPGP